VAEDIVNSLMPLLDVLNDVASGIMLQPGTSQLAVLQTAASTLPAQLNSLLAASGGGSSSGGGGAGGGSSGRRYSSSHNSGSRRNSLTAPVRDPCRRCGT